MGTVKLSSKQMPQWMKFFMLRIFPLIFVVVGAVIAFLGIRGLVRAKASLQWPSIQGQILESSVERHHSSGSNGSSTTYHAEILYKFILNDTTFNGNRVAYGDYGSSNPSHARQIVNKYPKNKIITVYYMPDNPEECLLEPGVKMQSWFLPAFGIIFFTVGCLMAIFIPRAIRKQEFSKQTEEVF
jgi:hypothetical protein